MATFKTFKTRVIPKPAPGTRAIFVAPVAPIFRGETDEGDSHLCGSCGIALTKGLQGYVLQDLVFKCPGCGKYSEV